MHGEKTSCMCVLDTAIMSSTVWLLALLLYSVVESQGIIPSSYVYTQPGVSVNGSNAIGYCSYVTIINNTYYTCGDPTSSVLFDGHIPTLTGLDGDMWASQLLAIQTAASSIEINFEFHDSAVKVERVEVVMFNCQQWGIGAWKIQTLDQNRLISTVHTSISSCDSLVRVCVRVGSFVSFLALRFIPHNSYNYSHPDWVMHLAEVTIFGDTSVCQQDIVITQPPITLQDAITSPTITPLPGDEVASGSQRVSNPTTYGMPPSTCEMCSSCSTSIGLASAFSAIIMALLATVIFVLVQIAVCKCRPKSKTGTLAGKGNDVDEEGVATCDPTYMEVGVAVGKTFELKQNAAYGTHIGK